MTTGRDKYHHLQYGYFEGRTRVLPSVICSIRPPMAPTTLAYSVSLVNRRMKRGVARKSDRKKDDGREDIRRNYCFCGVIDGELVASLEIRTYLSSLRLSAARSQPSCYHSSLYLLQLRGLSLFLENLLVFSGVDGSPL